MLGLRKLRNESKSVDTNDYFDLPTLSLIIPAFNEENWIDKKIRNSLDLEYPESKIEIIVVTDGSTDSTNTNAARYGEDIILLHQQARNGKINAMDRAARIANNELLVFTDANTLLNPAALVHISKEFSNTNVGMVSGEKSVKANMDGESATGEGIYWRYESWLKKLDSDVSSVIGAAGELFAIRSDLYDTLPEDTILDDFMLSSRVISLGYKVAYQPKAVATEYGSSSYKEEWKRKVRICAGGLQSTLRSLSLFNVKRHGISSFSFLVHRVARWTLAPLALLISYLTSVILIPSSPFYALYFFIGSFALLVTYYAIHKNEKNLPKPLLLIVYFTFMHLSAIAGWFRYLGNNQSVNWERSARLG